MTGTSSAVGRPGTLPPSRRQALTPGAESTRDLSADRFHLRRAGRWLIANLLVVALLAIVAAALLEPAPWESLEAVLQLSGILTVAAATVAAVGLNTIRWILLWRAELGPSSWAMQGLFYLSGNAMSATPGRSGELIRLWLNRRCTGVPYFRSLPVFALDRIADTASVALCGLIGLALIGGDLRMLLPAAGLLALAATVLRYPAPWLALLRNARSQASGFRRSRRLLAALGLMLRRMALMHDRPAVLSALLVGCGSRLAQGAGLALTLSAMGCEISLPLALAAHAAGSLAGAASMLPGGLGAAELAIVGILAGAGQPIEAVIASVLLFRIGSLWIATGLGIVALSASLALRKASIRFG
ncbi:MAG: flippase-like domain-containing protein [Alphaproteobacteria bacterium]|nr:flippase-like domain-containing protein [Alphaproteobacteria bacterium]